MTTSGKIDHGSQTELNLLDIFIVLLKYKWLILSIVLGTTIIALGYLYLSPKQSGREILPIVHAPVFFYSECLIEPEKGSMEKLNWLFLRRNFVFQMIAENNLLLEIEKAILKEMKPGEEANGQLSKRDVYRWIRQNLFLTPAGSVLTIGFAATQEDLPPKIINGFLKSLSEYLRRRDVGPLIIQQKQLRGRLIAANDPILKSRIADEILRVWDKESTMRNVKYYGFELLDPALLIDRVKINQKGTEKKLESLEGGVSPVPILGNRAPKRGMLLFLLILASFVVAVTLAFILDYIQSMKMRDPEKMATLKRYLSIRGK